MIYRAHDYLRESKHEMHHAFIQTYKQPTVFRAQTSVDRQRFSAIQLRGFPCFPPEIRTLADACADLSHAVVPRYKAKPVAPQQKIKDK